MVSPVFLRGEASFSVDGEDYVIVLDVPGWMAAERAAGSSLVQLMARIHAALENGDEPMTGDLAAILYGGLRREHSALTFEDAVNLLVPNYLTVGSALNEAIVASLPHSDGDPGNEAAPAQENGTGKGSSRSGAARGKGSRTSGSKRQG